MSDDTHASVRPVSGREGFALAAAVMALVLIGALVTGGFYIALRDGHVPRSTRYGDEALNIAEHGLNQVVGTWALSRFEAIAEGGSQDTVVALGVEGRVLGEADVDVRRLSDRTYFIASTGRVAQRGLREEASRTIGLMVRTDQLELGSGQALRTFGGLKMSGAAQIDGHDTLPDGWVTDDCPGLSDRPGVITRDASLVSGRGIDGDPPIGEDPEMSADDEAQLGAWDIGILAAQAEKVMAATSASVHVTAPSTRPDGTCDTSDPWNWGAVKDSDHPCHDYFPIIHAEGDLWLDGDASGQGTLLVNGDLHIRGDYEFAGIVIVSGKLMIDGAGKTIGAMVVRNGGDETGDDSVLKGSPRIRYSSCAVARAVRNNSRLARAVPIAERSWFDLGPTVIGS